ncbi:MAG TPA: carbohydrate ABC transporter permease [Gaiellales bacterium]|jgi:raffinose/stachyose/melibiose transport system permease protein|nr:carbohydrate ABC transporter permease [Gaiellales bacterium]
MTARIDRYTTYVVLIAFSLLAIYPMVSILFLAFHKKTDLVTGFSLPTTFSPQTFVDAWNEGSFGQGMWGSFLVAATVTVVSAVLSLFTGYAFGTMRFRGSGLLFNLIVVGLIFPYEATVIPLYYDFLNYHPAGINLAGSYWALILPQIGQSVTLGTFWMRAFFLSTPKALVEAGRIDGADSFRILRSILLPQARPALLTLCLLVFMYTWNEFLLALVLLAGSNNTTAPLGLSFFAGAVRGSDPTKVAAASVLVAAPVVLVYLFLQRHFIRGVLAGAIKE